MFCGSSNPRKKKMKHDGRNNTTIIQILYIYMYIYIYISAPKQTKVSVAAASAGTATVATHKKKKIKWKTPKTQMHSTTAGVVCLAYTKKRTLTQDS